MDNGFALYKPAARAPEISILFPVYNRENYVGESLESVLSQRNITAEILISDDASDDRSFEIALNMIENYCSHNICNHRIVVRKGRTRLRRDHIHLMAESAECDIVFQAHDDDISHRDRAKITLDAFRAFPAMNMMVVECEYIDQDGFEISGNKELLYPIVVDPVSISTIIWPSYEYIVGACQAWKRSSITGFIPLNSAYAPVSHDKINAFRCALTGEVRIAHAPLMKRRIHNKSWSNSMVPAVSEIEKTFGWNIIHLSCQKSMLKDLGRAFDLGDINEVRYNEVKKIIEQAKDKSFDSMMHCFHELILAGRIPSWTVS